MKNVKTLILVTLMSASLFASSQRVAALGGNVGFWPEDDASWTTFPTAINDLDMVQISGVDGDASASIVWGEGTTWAFQYNEADMAEEDWDAIDWMNIGWGNGTMGATFSLGSQSYDSGETGSTASSMTAFGATFGMPLAGMDFGAGFSSMSEDDGDSNTDDPTAMGIGFNLRRAQSLWLFDNMLVGFSNVSAAQGDATDSAMDLSVDLFTHIPANDNISVLFALGFGYSSSVSNSGAAGAEDMTASVMSLPQATLAVEGDLKDWATVRVGVNHAYLMGTNGDASWSGAYTEMGESTFNMTFGLGFNMGSFNLDMTVGEGLFSDPAPYLVGQNDEPLSSEGGVTLTYAF
jgi:hypothetical protein